MNEPPNSSKSTGRVSIRFSFDTTILTCAQATNEDSDSFHTEVVWIWKRSQGSISESPSLVPRIRWSQKASLGSPEADFAQLVLMSLSWSMTGWCSLLSSFFVVAVVGCCHGCCWWLKLQRILRNCQIEVANLWSCYWTILSTLVQLLFWKKGLQLQIKGSIVFTRERWKHGFNCCIRMSSTFKAWQNWSRKDEPKSISCF